MNNLNVTFIDEEVEDRRDMGELEIHGAMTYIYILAKEYQHEMHGETYVTLDEVDKCTFYCNQYLEVTEGGYNILIEGNPYVLDSVFMREGNRSDLWGYVSPFDEEDNNEDEENELLLIRI